MRKLITVFAIGVLLFAIAATPQRNDLGTARMIEALENIINEDGTCCNIPAGSVVSTLVFADAGSLAISDTSSDVVFTISDVPDLTGSDAEVNLVELDAADIGATDAGDTIRGMFIDLVTNASTTGGTVTGFEIDGITPRAAQETGFVIGNGWDTDIKFENTEAHLLIAAGGAFRILDAGAAVNFWLRDVPAAGTATDLAELDYTLSAMDGSGDIFRALLIDIAAADHSNGWVYGIDIDQDTNDAQSTDIALRMSAGWDEAIRIAGSLPIVFANSGELTFRDIGSATSVTIRDVPSAGTGIDLFELDTSLAILNGSDVVNGLLLDFTNANHTGSGNMLSAVSVLSDGADPDAFETGFFIDSDWDAHLTLEATGASTADDPPAGSIALYIDDNSDWSGGGGNDCALIARDSGGATDVIATLVLNGVCP